ncbi:FKBP-type peptidyl-prolyl cis-trans isomerase [Halodesulfurarchaeum sp.]|uniref:FKBP-type peptidyl-prolyl cis-trans isomerase n=1 Tax=Halodesulfurarchaeum sp. TaxID=1980530 RepID=UPI001BB82BB0|nr:FKBP-type peptidyl-prolyl cis-trans isomerase [Halodesulfurarchaeum sp.]
MTIDSGDSVTVAYTGRLDDGAVFDTSHESVAEAAGLDETQPERDYTPLTVEIGSNEVIEGLEDALRGMDVDETETVMIPPEKGFGEWTEERVRDFDTAELTEMLGGETPEEGAFIETQEGELAEITSVGDNVVKVDFNPQLAGETLEFEIEVLDVTPAESASN